MRPIHICLLLPFVYETPTHQVVSRRAAANARYLQRELREFGWADLAHGGAAYSALQSDLASFASEGISLAGSTPVDLIGKGGVTEDRPWRFLNHFLDGVTFGGLDVLVSGLPSDEWGCCTLDNQFRWEEANFWYERALLGHTAEEREDARVRVFRALGQAIHLVQDAYQPSHSRNDSHSHRWYLFDGHSELEVWGADAVRPASVDPQVALGLATVTSSASGATLQDFFRDAASFSNRRFFSDDTIFHNLASPPYASPSFDDTVVGSESVPILFGITQELEFLYSDSLVTPAGGPARLAREKHSLLDLFDDAEGDDYTLAAPDHRIVRDNASVLLPAALRSSMGVLDYFFRGDLGLAMKTVDEEGRLEVRNTSAAPGSGAGLALGSGELRLYYETVDDTLQPVPGFSVMPFAGLGAGETLLLEGDLETTMLELSLDTVPPAFRAVEDRTVTVVFEGPIGLEHGLCASQIDVKGFRIIEFSAPDFILDDGTPADLSFLWEGEPVFPVTFRFDKQTCNSAFWSDCDDDEAFSWFGADNPLELQLFISGCAFTTEFIGGEVYLADSTGRETQRVPWNVSAIFVGNQCRPGPGSPGAIRAAGIPAPGGATPRSTTRDAGGD